VVRRSSRRDVVERLIVLLRTAHSRGAELVVFPELALTTFFCLALQVPFNFEEDIEEMKIAKGLEDAA